MPLGADAPVAVLARHVAKEHAVRDRPRRVLRVGLRADLAIRAERVGVAERVREVLHAHGPHAPRGGQRDLAHRSSPRWRRRARRRAVQAGVDQPLGRAAREQGRVRVEAGPHAAGRGVGDHANQVRRQQRLAEPLQREGAQLRQGVHDRAKAREGQAALGAIERRPVADQAHPAAQVAGGGHLDLQLARQRGRAHAAALSRSRPSAASAARTSVTEMASRPGSTVAPCGSPLSPAHSARCRRRSRGGGRIVEDGVDPQHPH